MRRTGRAIDGFSAVKIAALAVLAALTFGVYPDRLRGALIAIGNLHRGGFCPSFRRAVRRLESKPPPEGPRINHGLSFGLHFPN